MKRRQIFEIAAILSISFAATIMSLHRPRTSGPADLTPLVSLRNPWQPPASEPTSAITSSPTPGAAADARSPTSSVSVIDIPPADDNGPPLPLMVAISKHVGDAQSDDENSQELRSEREVDVLNNSDELMAITVMAVDGPTQSTTTAQVLIRPQSQAHIGEDAGLKLEPGYLVTLRSRGYQEMTQTVD